MPEVYGRKHRQSHEGCFDLHPRTLEGAGSQEAEPSELGRKPLIQPIIASSGQEEEDSKEESIGKSCPNICTLTGNIGSPKPLGYGPDTQRQEDANYRGQVAKDAQDQEERNH